MDTEYLLQLADEYGALMGEPVTDIKHFIEWLSSLEEPNG
jgi:hypothetical protein